MTEIADRTGEIIEASTTEFVAQCYELYQSPPLGSLVKATSRTVVSTGIIVPAGGDLPLFYHPADRIGSACFPRSPIWT